MNTKYGEHPATRGTMRSYVSPPCKAHTRTCYNEHKVREVPRHSLHDVVVRVLALQGGGIEDAVWFIASGRVVWVHNVHSWG
eukprot:6023534-Pyramimonas_sp.AAC.1